MTTHKKRFDKVLTAACGADTVTIKQSKSAPHKEAGWCEAQGVEHAWEVQDYSLTTDPPQSVRICLNCGKRQYRSSAPRYDDWK